MSIKQLAEEMVNVRAKLDQAKAVAAELQKEFDDLRKVQLPEAMEAAGMESTRLPNIGTVSIRTDAYASIRGGQQDGAYQWMKDNGFGDLIKDFVHSSTLKAFLKEQFREGEDLPEEIFSFLPYSYVAITKSK
tara:strand:+ start:331 stop:729 length:399 start_codon:yes stop_codon:yes gene_type:complete